MNEESQITIEYIQWLIQCIEDDIEYQIYSKRDVKNILLSIIGQITANMN